MLLLFLIKRLDGDPSQTNILLRFVPETLIPDTSKYISIDTRNWTNCLSGMLTCLQAMQDDHVKGNKQQTSNMLVVQYCVFRGHNWAAISLLNLSPFFQCGNVCAGLWALSEVLSYKPITQCYLCLQRHLSCFVSWIVAQQRLVKVSKQEYQTFTCSSVTEWEDCWSDQYY